MVGHEAGMAIGHGTDVISVVERLLLFELFVTVYLKFLPDHLLFLLYLILDNYMKTRGWKQIFSSIKTILTEIEFCTSR